MHRFLRLAACLSLTALFLGGGLSAAAATAQDFSDVRGHWAQDTLSWAVEEGLLQGFEDGSLRPDAPISEAEILTLLTRVMEPPTALSPAALGLSGEEWYAETAGKAAALGLLQDAARLSNDRLNRLEALCLTARAFQLTMGDPDYKALEAYADWRSIPPEARPAMASLLDQGYVKGSGGRLHPESSISRAEFVTLLQRILPHHQAAEGPALRDVRAERLLLRLWPGEQPSLEGETQLQTLILTGGDGAAVTLSPTGAATVDSLILGDFRGNVTVSGQISHLVITGDNLNVQLRTSLTSLFVVGANNRITAGPEVTVSQVATDPYSRGNTLSLSGAVEVLTLAGENQSVTANGPITRLDLLAKTSRIDGAGSIKTLNSYAEGNTVILPAQDTQDLVDRGIRDLSLSLTSAEVVPAGHALRIGVWFDPPLRGPVATGQWLVDGLPVGAPVSVDLSKTDRLFLDHKYTYSREMSTSSQVSFRLSYKTEQGEEQVRSAVRTVTLENYSDSYYNAYDIQNVLKQVATGYRGNYTLAWAEENDYDQKTKELWINAKGHSSRTGYLIWINTTYQRVNIFEGSQGDWTLLRSSVVGTGRPGHDTPVGVYTVTTRLLNGWTTEDYHVSPVVRFKEGSGLAFHSRKYHPKDWTRLIDGSIGFPVSLGCIRMYDEDIQWIYDNIPQHTTVVVY